MPHVGVIGWHASAALAVCLAAAVLLLRGSRWHRARAAAAVAREGALVLTLFAGWQVAGQLALTRVDGAVERAHAIWRLERLLHLPSELALQHAVLPHPLLVQVLNGYYLYGHLNVMIVTLVWLFWRHREQYPSIRNALALSSALCLAVQLVPVAPPRMLTDLGFVDTALVYGQSVYGPMGSGIANQLSAMPSLHIGWAVIVAVAVVRAGAGPWRWLVVLHPLAMAVVVAGTANHWQLDGVVAAAIVVASLAAERRLAGARLGVPRSVTTVPAEARG